MRHMISPLLLLAGMGLGTPAAPELRREELMAALRTGGYTILLRHARTDRTYKEVMGAVPLSRIEQRNLNDDGVRDARLMGVVLKKYAVPIGEIISSPMFRTMETAEYAAGKPDTTMRLRHFPSTPEQAALVAAAPKHGTNRLLVTHHFVIENHVPGIQPGEIGESEAAIIRTSADGTIELVGRITLADWQALAGNGAAESGVSGHGRPGTGAYAAPHLTNADSAGIPDTPAGRFAKGYMAAFNSGSRDRMRAFIESNMVVNPSRTMEERVESYAGLFERFGTLTLAAGHTSQPNEVSLAIRAKPGPLRLIVKMSDTLPARVASVSFAMTEGGGHP